MTASTRPQEHPASDSAQAVSAILTAERTDAVSPFLSHAFVVRWETVAYVAVLLLAIFTRFYILGDRVTSHDESLHTRYSFNLYRDGIYQHTPLMHGPILFHMTALNYFLFGDNDFTARIYPAVLGVLLVMYPLLLRRWLGRWGALLTSIMLLISPLLMYYNRYIREDTPSIFSSLTMAYCILMYLSGPENQRRRSHWLYIFSAAMLWSLGSKETSFIYIAIFGTFVTLYWLARMAQHFWNLPGRAIFYFSVIGILIGGVASLSLYIILDIIPLQTALTAAQNAGWFASLEARSFLVWIGLSLVLIVGAVVGTMLVALAGRRVTIRWHEVVVILLIAVFVAMMLIVLEQASHVAPKADETARPAVPGEEAAAAESTFGMRWWPMVAAWVFGSVIVLGLLYSKQAGWWNTLERFPELDVIVVMGSLILPWLTAIVPYLMRGTSADYDLIASGLPNFITNSISNLTAQFSNLPVGLVVLYFLAAVPLFAVAITVGLVWNWRRWLVCVVIFHTLFALFFTTVFTNIWGLFSGMFYSLGYWLEQQSVRRGSQPQYYYLLLIMPFYEFLPVIGAVFAMLAGLLFFWRQRADQYEHELETREVSFVETLFDEADPEKGKPKRDDVEVAGDVPSEETPSFGELLGEDEGDSKVALAAWSGRSTDAVSRLEHLPFLLLVSWWAVLNLVAYSLAGEKMPWLGTHLTAPLILLAGWYFGRIFEKVDFRRFLKRGWLYLLLLPLLIVTLFQVAAPVLGGQMAAGLTQADLTQMGQWLAALAVSGILIYAIYKVVEQTGWAHTRHMFSVSLFAGLAVLTFRSAWMASFINYDYATEYLVYAHGAPAIKQVLGQLEELSLRTTDGLDLTFAYDNEVSWPYSWYFRNFRKAVYLGGNPTMQRLNNAVAVVVGEGNRAKVEPLLEDRYMHFEYIRLWWPMQDYFNLTPERIARVLDFSPEAPPQAAQIRQGLFDIWWSRDYSTYGAAVNRDFSVTRWPVADRMHVYIRKDIAAQIWPYGIGEATVLNPLEGQTISQCTANWQQLNAVAIFDTSRSPLNRPLGISIGADGKVYVAEENNARISVFDTQGNFLTSYGLPGSGVEGGPFFNRPNGISVAPDGTIFVADTWNYRIQALSPDGQVLRAWGKPGEYGFEAKSDPTDGFWGPRDIAVDSRGFVYVADTGNKRVRVYDAAGQFVRDIGSGGSGLGQLDEPVGLAIHPDGRLYVADTWNRRVAVFTLDGVPVSTFNVRGWYDELGNRPYLALDVAHNLLYATDPDAGRVLVYDTAGNCVGSFGQLNRESPGASEFGVLGGIAVDGEGFVYLADAGTARILKFAPFSALPAVSAPSGAGNGQSQVNPESTVETTAEVTENGQE